MRRLGAFGAFRRRGGGGRLRGWKGNRSGGGTAARRWGGTDGRWMVEDMSSSNLIPSLPPHLSPHSFFAFKHARSLPHATAGNTALTSLSSPSPLCMHMPHAGDGSVLWSWGVVPIPWEVEHACPFCPCTQLPPPHTPSSPALPSHTHTTTSPQEQTLHYFNERKDSWQQ